MNRLLPIVEDMPIPPPRLRNGHVASLRELKLNQNVLIPSAHSPYNLVRSAGLSGKVTSRKESGGWRVWRIRE